MPAQAENVNITSEEEMLDQYCDPNDPKVIDYKSILEASIRIKERIIRTPLTESRLSDDIGINLFFKKEYMQYTASFKDRGAANALLKLSNESKAKGVIAASAGNHAQAMAYQGRELGVPVTVVMPEQAPTIKVNSCKKLKAEVILAGNHFDAAKTVAMEKSKKDNLVYINGYDHPDVIAGQGTLGLEMIEQVDDLDYIIVPIGGGGLIAGVAAAVKEVKPHVKIIGVESSRCPSWSTAVKNGVPVKCSASKEGAKNSIADGLSVIKVGVNAFATANSQVDKVVTVNEDFISLAILKLLEYEKAVVEGAGATGLAAILSGSLPELKGKKVACILCGGNIDAITLNKVIDRGLWMDGRLCRFRCLISDRCGGLMSLLRVLEEENVSIRDLTHDRARLTGVVYKTTVTCTVECTSKNQSVALHQKLFESFNNDIQWLSIV